MKIYFLVATQHDNLGDLLINKMLIDELSKYGSVYVDSAGLTTSFKNVLISNNINDFEKEYGTSLKRIYGYKLLSVVRKDFDYYFKSPGPFGGIGYDFKSILRIVALAFQYNFLSKNMKMNLVGNDIIIKTKIDNWFQKSTFKVFDNYLVRSKENKDELLRRGYLKTNFIPDVGFLYEEKVLVCEKNKLCISFRDLNNENYKNQIETILKKTIPYFKNRGFDVEFFYQVESDYEFNFLLSKLFKAEGATFRGICLNYSNIPYYNQVKYVLTNRLHVMILGIIHGSIPLLLLNNDNKTSKINRIIDDNNLSQLIINSFTDIVNIKKNTDLYLKKINDIKAKNKIICKKQIQNLFENHEDRKK